MMAHLSKWLLYQRDDTRQIVILYFKMCSTVLFCCCKSWAVSLTSVLDKLSVVIMKNRIKRYMNIYDTLQESQHHLCRWMPHLASLLQSNHINEIHRLISKKQFFFLKSFIYTFERSPIVMRLNSVLCMYY